MNDKDDQDSKAGDGAGSRKTNVNKSGSAVPAKSKTVTAKRGVAAMPKKRGAREKVSQSSSGNAIPKKRADNKRIVIAPYFRLPPGAAKPAADYKPFTKTIEMELEMDDDVGYGRPPKEHQFKKGVSGHPQGRPVGAKTRRIVEKPDPLLDAIGLELDRLVPYTEKGVERQMTLLQMILRTHGLMGARGDQASAKISLDMAKFRSTVERRRFERRADAFARHKLESERRLIRGQPFSLPDPRQVELDHVNHEIMVSGPQNETERKWLEEIAALRMELREQMQLIEGELKAARSAHRRENLQALRAIIEEHVALITAELGDDGMEEDDADEEDADEEDDGDEEMEEDEAD